MHRVSLKDLRPALSTFRSSRDALTGLVQEDLQMHLEELFQSISPQLPEQVIPEATDQTTRLLFKLFDREKTGIILQRSVEAALIALCGDTLAAKHRGLSQIYFAYCRGSYDEQESSGGSISRSALRVLLDDLSQVPAAVQENHVFGPAETAVLSCFSQVTSGSVSEEQVVNWLHSEPRLLLWLSTLYRISVSEAVQHRVRCHACKAFPITGLRYRCLKCLNVHVCQSCFLMERRSRKHKPSHPVLEYCTQPSWKESMASLASSARHALVPRHTRREAERKKSLGRELHRSSSSPALETVAELELRSAAEPEPAVAVESKSLQTEETPQITERETAEIQKNLTVTQMAMRDLQRDKWLLEKEFQVWRAAAQTEHDSLEDKCSELKSMMEMLNQHNQNMEEQLQTLRQSSKENGPDEEVEGKVLSLRDKDDPSLSNIHREHVDSINVSTRTQTGSPTSYPSSLAETEEQTCTETNKEERVEGEEETEVSEDISTNLDDTDNIPDVQREEPEDEDEELLEREEELRSDAHDPFLLESLRDLALELDSGSEDSEKDEEEELCAVVQRLQIELSLHTAAGSMSVERELLLTAAEGVRDSVSQLVTSVKRHF
ncbi:hypothetical protein DNTS_025568 [Danionella cerebrum]|uniref:ZZ-type domain-containing protein n=1 Tax=Danionella cerebrum TaxID=2873325 RepID=A0A553PYN2_9TELE|nr:hypothetical protein DNTS_025568 [Danionella translucida]